MSVLEIDDHYATPYPVDAMRSGKCDRGFYVTEVERVPVHRGEYNPDHWGERHPKEYNALSYLARRRKPGEAL